MRTAALGRLWQPMKILGFILLMVGLAYLAITQMLHLFYGTSYFELRQIEVEGLSVLTREEIVRVAGVAPGVNILELDKEGIRQRVFQHPWVASVEVSLRGLYSLQIRMTERRPLLYAKCGTTFYLVAQDGVILSTEGFGEEDLPIITGLNFGTRRAGDSMDDNAGFHEARDWVGKLSPTMLKNISEINFASLNNPYVFLISGVKIIPKNLEDFIARYAFLCALLDNLRRNNVEPDYLDMRAPSEIVVKPRRSGQITERGG